MFVYIAQHQSLLVSLNLANNAITHLDALSSLPSLKSLNVSFNALRVWPPELATCTRLAHLDIFHNRLDSLASIPPMPALTALDGTANLFADASLAPISASCPSLKALALGSNPLTGIEPSHLAPLAGSLTSLDLSGPPMLSATTAGSVVTPVELFEFLQATPVYATLLSREDSDALFEEVDADLNGSLDESEMLVLNTKLRAAINYHPPPISPDLFSTLPSLTSLAIASLGLTVLPETLTACSTLTELDVSGNTLTELPSFLGRLPLAQLQYAGNEITAPPQEIMALGTPDILAYLRVLAEGASKCYRSKLMLVGLGGAGKTSSP